MVNLRRRDLIWAAAFVVLLSLIWIVDGDRAEAGAEPPGDGIDLVLVAVSNNFPDALGASPGAAVYSAPIILLPSDPPIPGVTQAELARLDPRQVVIVGGTGVISTEMETALGDLLPNADISRLAGSNRYETNTMLSEIFFPVEGWVSVGPADFTTFSPATDATSIYGNAVWSDELLVAPVRLPDGAEILELRAGVKDSSGSDIRVQLVYVTWDGYQGVIAQQLSSGTPGNALLSTTDIDQFSRFVDNQTTAYMVAVGESSGAGDLSSTLYPRTVMVKYRLGIGGPPTA